MLVSDEINFKTKINTRNKEGHFIMKKVLVHQKLIIVIKH